MGGCAGRWRPVARFPGPPGRARASHNGEVNDSIPVVRVTEYGTAKLMPDVDRERAWMLTVDGAPQSYVDLDEPTYLEFEYARRLGYVLDAVAEAGAALDVLHLGGGALTLPRYVAATRAGSRQDVVDADRGLLDLVTEHLPLADDAGIALHAADARGWLEGAPGDSADVIIGDVFGGSRIPAHLTSTGYAREAERVLRADGVYLANLADSAPFAFLRSQLATFSMVFEELAVIAEPGVLRGRRFGNAVLIASHRPIDAGALARRTAADAFPARVEHGPALREFVGGARPVGDADAVPSPEPPGGTFGIG